MFKPGGRANVFSFYVIIITLTLRFRLRYVNVAGVTFSFTLRSRSGREAHRGSRFKDPGRHFPAAFAVFGTGQELNYFQKFKLR